MTFDESTPPNWDRLRELNEEADALIAEDRWTKDEFDRLMVEAEKAVNGHTEFLEGLEMKGEDFAD